MLRGVRTSLFPGWIDWISSKDKHSQKSNGAEQAALRSPAQPAVLSSLYGQKTEEEKRAQHEYQTYDAFLPAAGSEFAFPWKVDPLHIH